MHGQQNIKNWWCLWIHDSSKLWKDSENNFVWKLFIQCIFICQRTRFINSVSQNNFMCGLWVAHYRQTSTLYYTATSKLHVPEPERSVCCF